jgi:hypothetical protein
MIQSKRSRGTLAVTSPERQSALACTNFIKPPTPRILESSAIERRRNLIPYQSLTKSMVLPLSLAVPTLTGVLQAQ